MKQHYAVVEIETGEIKYCGPYLLAAAARLAPGHHWVAHEYGFVASSRAKQQAKEFRDRGYEPPLSL